MFKQPAILPRLLLVCSLLNFATFISSNVNAETIRIFTWEGYVKEHEVIEVNKRLAEQGYDHTIEVITPWAEGPEQFFDVIRNRKADIFFLTLNYIQMQRKQISRLIQPINTSSPRLTNYNQLLPQLKKIPMGSLDERPLYIPWGGGAYGIWANMDFVKSADLPRSIKDLWHPKWQGKLSLTRGQIHPNIALASMALGLDPFHLHNISGDTHKLRKFASEKTALQLKLNHLYQQVGIFWDKSPKFNDEVVLMASYGPGVSAKNMNGGNWQLITFQEGNTAWLDTINFSRDLTGTKLEAAEIFANYFIGKEVQTRVSSELGMVAASSLATSNPLLRKNSDFFNPHLFWPPYNLIADNIMRKISDRAMRYYTPCCD